MRPAAAVLTTLGAIMFALSAAVAAEPGTPEWDRMQNDSARDRVRMDALQRAQGDGGGCRRLPAGWAAMEVKVDFPAEYRGYPAWVNSAELLPVGDDLHAFLAGGAARDALVRPAAHNGMTVTSRMCAPGGRAYWVIVDSGRAKVAVGQVKLGPGPGPYHVAMTAPPLHK
jgi:hypothetical protein